MDLENIKRNKRILAVAAELAGKGKGNTPHVLGGYEADEQEEIKPTQQTPDYEYSQVEEDFTHIIDFIINEIQEIEESLNFELEDHDLDFVIEKVIDQLMED